MPGLAANARIAVLGGGPAGLYVATLIKRRMREAHVAVFEQNPADATFGFGVVFSDQALAFLNADDTETARAIAPAMETWSDMTLVHRGETVTLDGVGFSSIGRLALLQMLQARAADVGVTLHYDTPVTSLDLFASDDLIIGADGVNSLVRRTHEAAFAPTLGWLANKFVWYGTAKPFDTLTQTFVETPWGAFNAHHYRYAPDASTFIVECQPDTWARAGFEALDADATKARCETIFADTLEGHALLTNKSVWRNFPQLMTRTWHHGNRVLLGDALHTAHFSIGSGTRMALEDALALDKALADLGGHDLEGALAQYQASRQPIVEKIVNAAQTSARWYERFDEKMRLDPLDFGFDYITRSGRIDLARLRSIAPGFMARYEAAAPARIDDPVAAATPGALEIGFDATQHTNAAAILFDNLKIGNSHRPALHGPAGTLTYAALCAFASRYANALRGAGLARGDRVILFLDDTPSCVAAFFGALRAGFVPVVLNTLTPPELLAFYLEDSAAKVAIVEGAFAPAFNGETVEGSSLETLIIANGEAAALALSADALTDAAIESDAACPQVLSEAAFLEGHATSAVAAPTRHDDMAFWLYSSGSTGRPKGIVHLHHDMAYTAQSYAAHVLKLTRDDICYSPPKIFFAYGLGNTLTFPFSVGAASVLMPGQPRAPAVLDAIETYRPTVFFALPTLYTALAQAAGGDTHDLTSLRLSISAAEILSPEITQAWRARTGLSPIEGLGSTELLHIYLSNTAERQKAGAAGVRVPGYEVELRDGEGQPVGDGEEGILWVRGHSSAPLYWNRPDKTAETMRGDWIYTGDRFVRDEDGFHFFKGRADDLVKVSGQWVYPLEVEQCLATHPDVIECAVAAYQMPDQRMSLRAYVALKGGEPANEGETTRALQAFVKTGLLPYKYPRDIVYLRTLPKTGTGKLDRQRLAALSAGST
ncbi:MAG: benzoate-CoA ligase family protein [Pseudomonadota bacterium]